MRIRQFQPPEGSYFLFGARGTGKSSFVRQAYGSALYIDLLDPAVAREYLSRPERLRELILAQPAERIVVIDEVQKVPDLLQVVHGMIEARGTRFVLTGSSARKLRRSGVDLLAGRAALRYLHPYIAAELGEEFVLDKALQSGMVPLINEAADPQSALRAYVSLYIREEVFQEGLVRNIGSFSRFLEAVSFSHGQVLNYSSIAREAQVERKSIEGYVSILEDLLIAFRLPVFTRRAKRELIAHDKLYLFDAGVYRSLRPQGPLDSPEVIGSVAFEGLIAQHLRAWLSYRQGNTALGFWRTRAGVEVDFVLYGDVGLVAIEAKYSSRVRTEDLRGLKAFMEDYPEATCNLVYMGEERLLIDGILCLPVKEFMRGLTT